MNPTRWLVLVLVSVLCLTGCSIFRSGKGKDRVPKPAKTTAASAKSNQQVLVTPATGLSGRVASVNLTGQFVVVTLQAGQTPPAPEQKLSVYRGGLKVGELKVSREQMGLNLVADIVAGEAKAGDEVRMAEGAN
ncbi:MAG: hypothetical protein HZA90_21085 [Verrucomicrobia bacterium]|nr:hypothetical protein [Verrucomicrobiota bacterium]